MKKIAIILLSMISLHVAAKPLDEAKPWTFWYWMYGAVSKQGIHADLQGMHDVGLGGCYLMPIRGVNERPEYGGKAQQLSATYWDMIDYAFQQADSLGLQMGIHISDGFALAGGPWIKPEESMQHVVWTDSIVSVSKTGRHSAQRSLILSRPSGYYEDIACYAIPINYVSLTGKPKITLSENVVRNEKGIYRADNPCWIQYEYDKPTTVRNITIVTSGTNIQGERICVLASNDGKNFHKVKQLTQPRQGWQSYLFDKVNYSLPTTTAKYFRFAWTPDGSEGGSEDLDAAKWKPNLKLKDIILSSEPLLSNYLIKSGALWGIGEKNTSADFSKNLCTEKNKIVQIKLHGDTVISKLPHGSWRIIRMGHASTGMTNATAGGGKGLECDKFSPSAVNKQVDNWFALHKKRPHGDVVKFLHVDSWECGSQNWGYHFAEEFKARRGYDLIPYLPVMAGIAIESAEKSEQVLYDIRLTINDLINEKFFKTVAERAKAFGVKLSSESVAPTMVSDGMDHYKYVDLPMGEFWLNSPTHDKPTDMLDAIHGGYLYGKNIIQAEGLTEVRGVWDETPAMVKPLIDHNFALGINRLFLHVNAHNPWLDRRPGMTLDGIGFFFQRDNTWYKEASDFVDYITRCQRLLQEGKPVIDIPVYNGTEMPRRALTANEIMDKPQLKPLFRKEDVEREILRRANVGQPMEESPVGVSHAKNILRADDFTNPLQGYKYFTTNKPVNDFTLPAKDADLPDGVDFAHRHSSDRDIYFLTNQSGKDLKFAASFRVNGKKALLYDAVTDKTYLAGDFCEKDGRSFVSLSLAKDASLFVIFTNGIKGYSRKEQLAYSEPLNAQKWQVVFRDNKECVETDTLFDWSKYDNTKIKYYSGHAVYTTTFKFKHGKQNKVMLNLGEVKDIATVYVNGINCGTAWTTPYEVDITEAVKKGTNALRIVVVNTWANALLGDDINLPPFRGIWTNAKYRRKSQTPISAGLLGKITLNY